MKKITIFTLGAALIAVPALAAPGAKPGGADGVMTRAEVQGHAAQMFAKMDANKDGKIDATDRAARHAEMQAKRFAALDANSDGNISKGEWDQRAADRSERKDKRVAAGEAGHGKRDGMRGHHGKRGGHGMRGGHGGWMKADANGDKAITQAEFQTAALARFDAADANKDGQVTPEERKAQRGEWRAKRGAAPAAPAGE